MEAITFIINYESYLEEIREVVRHDLEPIIDELLTIDPHDLIQPSGYYGTESDARGYVWSLFLKKVIKYSVRSCKSPRLFQED